MKEQLLLIDIGKDLTSNEILRILFLSDENIKSYTAYVIYKLERRKVQFVKGQHIAITIIEI